MVGIVGSSLKLKVLFNRSITAFFLLTLVVYVLFFASFQIYLLVIAGLAIGASLEFVKLIPIEKFYNKILYILSVLIVLVLAIDVYPAGILAVSLVWWLYITSYILFNRKKNNLVFPSSKFAVYFSSLMLIVPFFLSLIVLRNNISDLLYLLILIWIFDIACYLGGNFFGKHKLAMHISPGKTVEGLAFGIVFSLIFVIWLRNSSFVIYYGGSDIAHLSYATACLVLYVALGGDLFESLLKRRVGIKDSGFILPGHGGLLDRLDSLMAAVPVFLYEHIIAINEFAKHGMHFTT